MGGSLRSLFIAVTILVFVCAAFPVQAVTFPSSGWVVLTDTSSNIADSLSDATADHRNIVGDSTNPSLYINSDATNLYFRMLLDETPTAGGGAAPLKSFGWGVAIDSDGDFSDYEILIMTDGITENVNVCENTTRTGSGDGTDTAETCRFSYSTSTHAQVTAASTSLNGDADYYIDYAVSWTDLGSLTMTYPITSASTLYFAFGTSNNAQKIQTDFGSPSSGTTLSDVVTDPLSCTPLGCVSVDVTEAQLTSFTSSTADATYGPGSTVNITANYNETLADGSTITVLLDTGVSVELATRVGATLSGTYTVGATGSGENSSDLTVSSISSQSVLDVALNLNTSTTLPSTNIATGSAIVIDTTAPVISEVTAVTTTTNDNTPNYTFTTNTAGAMTLGGSCQSVTDTASVGSNTITFDSNGAGGALSDATYSNCTITVTDAAGNTSEVLDVTAFTVDTTAPVISEVTAVSTPTNDSTPNYTFTTNTAGAMTLGGSCQSVTDTASVGSNTITFDSNGAGGALSDATYSNCTVTVTDTAGNASSALNVTAFTVDTTAPVLNSFTSTTESGTYGPTDVITITANYNEALGSASTITVVLDNGVTVVLDSIVGSTLSGEYTVGATGSGEDTTDLTVSTIDSQNVVDVSDNTLSDNDLPPTNLAASKDIVIDATAPILSEQTAVLTPTGDSTPSYAFNSDAAGPITFAGGCSSETEVASVGVNNITLASNTSGDALPDATYDSCTIVVTDAFGNASDALPISEFSIFTNDSDADGLPDLTECPTAPPLDGTCVDTDDDGTPDYLDTDSDADGVSDEQEILDGTDYLDLNDVRDSDYDGVPDAVEVEQGTDPEDGTSVLDTDDDGFPDYVENLAGSDGNDVESLPLDTDGDGVADATEGQEGTNPNDDTSYDDHDGDGVANAVEVAQHTDPDDIDAVLDTDNDGVPDAVEGEQGTDPEDGTNLLDTDADGSPDYVEDLAASDKNDSESLPTDTDEDGVPDVTELQEGTDINDSNSWDDADADGVPNAVEVDQGTDPNDPEDYQDTDGDTVPDYSDEDDDTPTGDDDDSGDDDDDSGDDDDDSGDDDDTPVGDDDTGDKDDVPVDDDDTGDHTETPPEEDDDTDTDGDGLSDAEEAELGTDPNDGDTDGDGLTDGYEYNESQTNPLDMDTDGDGVLDGVEDGITNNPNGVNNYSLQGSGCALQRISGAADATGLMLIATLCGFVIWRLRFQHQK